MTWGDPTCGGNSAVVDWALKVPRGLRLRVEGWVEIRGVRRFRLVGWNKTCRLAVREKNQANLLFLEGQYGSQRTYDFM